LRCGSMPPMPRKDFLASIRIKKCRLQFPGGGTA
jgi:hypothetical protein